MTDRIPAGKEKEKKRNNFSNTNNGSFAKIAIEARSAGGPPTEYYTWTSSMATDNVVKGQRI